MWNRFSRYVTLFFLCILFLFFFYDVNSADEFRGTYFDGAGDVEYLKLLDISRRVYEPDAEYQNLAMLYTPNWNGLVEGEVWGMWWVQNSYGPTYCSLPFLSEPYRTFLQNSQDCWFRHMGDGQWHFVWRSKDHGPVPDGALCDCASKISAISKQGDGQVELHDWGMEFTAAGGLMQAELLLIDREKNAIAHYLPLLERCANFIETRRDPQMNLFLAGPAGNLLAPSYAGWKKPDGTFGKAYLTGLSITYIGFLDRLIELEVLAGNLEKKSFYTQLRDLAQDGLKAMMTDEGYFIRSLDPDGTRHGIYGAEKYGYFDAICNHDAMCFRLVDDAQAQNIYNKLTSIPDLRPHDLIITNAPTLDDMYHRNDGIFSWGRWVNGGHWSTCEARMIMGYYRVGAFEDILRSMRAIMKFADTFQMDNPIKDFGNTPWHTEDPVSLCYDNFGPYAGMIRGLFEYVYSADSVTLIPHIPPKITSLRQKFPIRFGSKRLYLAVSGSGPITAVKINGKNSTAFKSDSIQLRYDALPDLADIQISLGDASAIPLDFQPAETTLIRLPVETDPFWTGDEFVAIEPDDVRETVIDELKKLKSMGFDIQRMYDLLVQNNLNEGYFTAHARTTVNSISAIKTRCELIREGRIKPLPLPSRWPAMQSYLDCAKRLCEGFLEKINNCNSCRLEYVLWEQVIADKEQTQ